MPFRELLRRLAGRRSLEVIDTLSQNSESSSQIVQNPSLSSSQWPGTPPSIAVPTLPNHLPSQYEYENDAVSLRSVEFPDSVPDAAWGSGPGTPPSIAVPTLPHHLPSQYEYENDAVSLRSVEFPDSVPDAAWGSGPGTPPSIAVPTLPHHLPSQYEYENDAVSLRSVEFPDSVPDAAWGSAHAMQINAHLSYFAEQHPSSVEIGYQQTPTPINELPNPPNTVVSYDVIEGGENTLLRLLERATEDAPLPSPSSRLYKRSVSDREPSNFSQAEREEAGDEQASEEAPLPSPESGLYSASPLVAGSPSREEGPTVEHVEYADAPCQSLSSSMPLTRNHYHKLSGMSRQRASRNLEALRRDSGYEADDSDNCSGNPSPEPAQTSQETVSRMVSVDEHLGLSDTHTTEDEDIGAPLQRLGTLPVYVRETGESSSNQETTDSFVHVPPPMYARTTGDWSGMVVYNNLQDECRETTDSTERVSGEDREQGETQLIQNPVEEPFQRLRGLTRIRDKLFGMFKNRT